MEYINLHAQYKKLEKEINENIKIVLENSNYILGEQVQLFESCLAQYVGRKYAITCSDGTAALQLIYMAYGIGKNDVVFCPDMTFIASIEPAVMLGAVPVFCDIDKKTYNIDPVCLERQIIEVINEGKYVPKAVVAVDFLGNPAEFDKINDVAKKYGLLVIEDAAQGIGAQIGKRMCGSFGDISATSFFPSKPLGCYGDGGAVFVDDDAIANTIMSLRSHGKGIDKYHNIRIGINSRLDTIQAAILIPKLKELPIEMEKRTVLADYYSKILNDYVITPFVAENNISSYAQYVIQVESREKRDELRKVLEKNGVPSLIYYPCPMHSMPVFEDVPTYNMNYDNSTHYSECSVGIPFSPYITKEEQDYVSKLIISVCKQ
ncbi:MAG: DegT/DnrJ/EryC1/StrS family aminotransferase [Lachnospiraceae bacterium]|nr:DegT/DnrJ/EryC1/StrS family aminotransferase [Lachnospiraceae bacterium]